MVRVSKISLNASTKVAKVSLEADTKAEMTNITTDEIIGFPKGYTIDFMSDVFTAGGDLGFMQSDGTWNWGDE